MVANHHEPPVFSRGRDSMDDNFFVRFLSANFSSLSYEIFFCCYLGMMLFIQLFRSSAFNQGISFESFINIKTIRLSSGFISRLIAVWTEAAICKLQSIKHENRSFGESEVAKFELTFFDKRM